MSRLRWIPKTLLLGMLLASFVAPEALARRRSHRGRRATKAQVPKKPPAYHKARRLFKQGIKQFDNGYYQQAIRLFQQALHLYPSPKIHTRIASAYKWLGNNLKALEHCEIFLKQFPTEPKSAKDRALRARTLKVAARLRSYIGIVTIRLDQPPGLEVRVDGVVVGRSPLTKVLRLAPGRHHVSVVDRGYYPFHRDLSLHPGQRLVVPITVVKTKLKVIRQVVVEPAAPFYKRWWFWTVVGLAVAAGAGGTTAWALTRDLSRAPTGVPLAHDQLGGR